MSRAPRPQVSQAELDRMVALLAEGRTMREVGAALGVSAEVVRARVIRLRRKGVAVKAGGGVAKWCAPKVADDVLLGVLRERLGAGHTLREVAAEVGMSYGNLRARVVKLRARGEDVPRLVAGNGHTTQAGRAAARWHR